MCPIITRNSGENDEVLDTPNYLFFLMTIRDYHFLHEIRKEGFFSILAYVFTIEQYLWGQKMFVLPVCLFFQKKSHG